MFFGGSFEFLFAFHMPNIWGQFKPQSCAPVKGGFFGFFSSRFWKVELLQALISSNPSLFFFLFVFLGAF